MLRFDNHGNLLDADVEALVNTVNTQGVMGKGIALQFKRAFPANYEAYRRACKRGEVALGTMFTTSSERLGNPRLIINFPTKGHWKSRSRLADIESGLLDLRRVFIEQDVRSAAIPPLGCGLGGLDWADVRPRIEDALGDLDLDVVVFEPAGAPAPEAMVDRRVRPEMTPMRAALVGLLDRYLQPGDSASPLVVQKLLYLLQEAGEPLGLEFFKGQLGPYADAIRHEVIEIEGHFVHGYGDGTGSRDIHVLPGAAAEAEPFLAEHPETVANCDRVVELIDGFETPYGLELLATTHWLVKQEGIGTADEATTSLRAWSERKERMFTSAHVQSAWNRLDDRGWLTEHAAVPA